MATTLTPAQLAQQGNRDASGRYREAAGIDQGDQGLAVDWQDIEDPEARAQAWAQARGVRMRVDNSWFDGRSWKVTLIRPSGTIDYSIAVRIRPANAKQPTAGRVLNTLANDWSTLQDASGFEDWAYEHGLDMNDFMSSYDAERVYEDVKGQADAFQDFVGEDLHGLVYGGMTVEAHRIQT